MTSQSLYPKCLPRCFFQVEMRGCRCSLVSRTALGDVLDGSGKGTPPVGQ